MQPQRQAVEEANGMKWQCVLCELKRNVISAYIGNGWSMPYFSSFINEEKTWIVRETGSVFIMNLECVQSKSVCVLWWNPGPGLNPPWINKFHTRKHLILSLREHLILLPVVSNLITTASKITPKANQAGRNHTNTWVTEEQNGLVSQHCFHWDPHYTAYIRNN